MCMYVCIYIYIDLITNNGYPTHSYLYIFIYIYIYCEQFDPCPGCYLNLVVPLLLVTDECHAESRDASLFSIRLSHCLAVTACCLNSACCTCCVISFPLTPPMPVVSSDHGHERGNFELRWFCYLNYAYVHKTCHSAPPFPHTWRE